MTEDERKQIDLLVAAAVLHVRLGKGYDRDQAKVALVWRFPEVDRHSAGELLDRATTLVGELAGVK